MSTSKLAPALLLTSLVAAPSCDDDSRPQPLRERSQAFTCDLVRVISDEADGSHGEHWSCIDGPGPIALDPEFEDRHRSFLLSGRAKLSIDRPPQSIRSGEVIDAASIELINEPDAQAPRNQQATTGQSTVLVLRVMADDSPYPLGEEPLAASVFGSSNDHVNVASQYDGCSHGQKTLRRAEGNDVHDGVLTVTLDTPAAGNDSSTLVAEATARAEARLGIGGNDSLGSVFDHVMYCIPPGTNDGWFAYAYLNGYRSVYNGLACTYPSAQGHELGHNLGLHHAGDGTEEYGDTSGLMGYGHTQDEGPKVCFNAAKSSHLGWYAERETTITEGTSGIYTLLGATDYPDAEGSEAVLLEVAVPSVGPEHSVHIAYNTARGPNEGTLEAIDEVTVVEQVALGGKSTIRAALTEASGRHEFRPFDSAPGTVTVEVLERGQRQGIPFARVRVDHGGSGGASDDSSNNGLTPASFAGTYARFPVDNDWHDVEVVENGGELMWTNAADMAWPLSWSGDQLRAGTDCPYGEQALDVIVTDTDGAPTVTGLRFLGDLYQRQ